MYRNDGWIVRMEVWQIKNEHSSIKIHVVKSRETFLKISTQFALSVIYSLLRSAVSLTCYFSRPPCFQHFPFSDPGEIESLLRRERKERPHTSIYFLNTSEVWNRDTVRMIRLSICYFPSFPKMLYNYDNINLSPAAILAQGTKVMTAKLKLISEPIEVYLCKSTL